MRRPLPKVGLHGPAGALKRTTLLGGRNSHFLRYVAWFEGAQGALLERSGDDVPLFPCALPYPEVRLLKEALEGSYEDGEFWGKVLVNHFVAWSNFVVLGCPKEEEGSAREPQGGYRSASDVRMFADKLLGEAKEFITPALLRGTLPCEGKRGEIEGLLDSCTVACYGDVPGAKVDAQGLSVAIPVVADRVAVPEEAGLVDPCQWLPPERGATVAALDTLRLSEDQWREIVVACHRVPVSEEAGLVRRLLSRRMVVLLPESDLPRDQEGRLMPGGLFCVKKNAEEDRLIFDRRPENATMVQLDWTRLPSGACFCRMLLGPNEFLRGSGDDLRNYYYTLALPDAWIRYNAVGRRVDPAIVAEAGLDPAVPHRACFRVLGMGDINGCAIAQATHEAVLQRKGLLEPESALVYGEPVPRERVWEGAYLDDLLVTYRQELPFRIPLDGSFSAPAPQAEDPDMVKTALAEAAYKEAGFERALHKSFRGLTCFKAWGAEVDGVLGRVGAPLEVRRQIWVVIQKVVALGAASRRVLQKVVG